MTTRKNAYSALGEDTQIECEAVGNPKPTFVWKWQDKKELIYVNDRSRRDRIRVKVVHGHESSVCILSIYNVQPSDFHTYICSAKNIHGFSQLHVRFMEYSKYSFLKNTV